MTDPKEIQSILTIAHDIRQMLMVITGRAGLLLEQDLEPEWKRHLQAMDLAATDANAMLTRLPGMGGGLFTDGSASLLDVARESCRLILPRGGVPWATPAQPPNPEEWTMEIRIEAQLKVALPAQILREVINNLLTNALAVMPSGGGIVMTGLVEDGKAQLTVQDSGPGVPPDLTDRVFETGFTTSGKAGRGLGLAGCRALLEPFGGTLTLAPERGPGAVFVISLPLAQDVLSPEPETEPGLVGVVLEPGEILVVDDEPAVQEMLSDVLTELGWQPSVAVNAAQALEIFSPGRFLVALVDQSLPGVTGLELASELREMDQRLVLVLVTGWGNEDIMSRAPASGIDITEEKPLALAKIRSILGQADALLRVRDKERK